MEAKKGEYQGLCNRSACLKPGANWYNHSTRAYYCESCAQQINYWAEHDHNYSVNEGHKLCTKTLKG